MFEEELRLLQGVGERGNLLLHGGLLCGGALILHEGIAYLLPSVEQSLLELELGVLQL